MKTVTQKLQLIVICGSLLTSAPLAPKNAPARSLRVPLQEQLPTAQIAAHIALYNPQAHRLPRTKPTGLLKNLSWNIYAYAITDIVFYGLHRKEHQKTLAECHRHLKEILHVTALGFVKEVVLRMLWDLDKKNAAVILHLLIQNLCWFTKQPNSKGRNTYYAESTFKTFVPPLLILAQKIRRQN